MKRAGRALAMLGGLLVLLVGGQLGFYAWRARQLPVGSPADSAGPFVRGAYHVHSRLSDGRGSPEQIAHAAARAGLQFVVLTDHNLMELPPPRWEQGVLLIFETELSTPVGHLVAIGIDKGLSAAEREGDFLGIVHARQGAAFIAHPVQIKRPWDDWSVAKTADGMELYSGDSFLRGALADPARILLPAIGTYWVRPVWGLWLMARASPPTRAKLVEMADGRRVSALCAHDAHGIPAYSLAFRALAVELERPEKLAVDPQTAAREVRTALRQGSFHCRFGEWAATTGFALTGFDAERTAKVGSVLRLSVPPIPAGEVRVELQGDAGASWDAASQTLRTERVGLLWVEIWVRPQSGSAETGWLPWIVSGPVRVSP